MYFKQLVALFRVKDWAKNFFLFLPLFFSGDLLNTDLLSRLIPGFFAFSFVASAIYIINDYRDIKDDQKHPIKRHRPLASGSISPAMGLTISLILVASGFLIAALVRDKFLFILGIYFVLNLAYSFGMKNIPILDIIIVAIGFVLRVKCGSVITHTALSEWIVIMVFLLALFMAIGKRRDDVLIKLSSGNEMRKSVKGYNLEFLNTLLAFVCAVIVVAYFMYTMSEDVLLRLGTHRLYYTCLFVLSGIMRYLQIIYVSSDSGSPTKILYKDRFIQISLFLWIASFILLIYFKDVNIFS